MKLNFLGKGSAFYPIYGNTCAYFLHNKKLYLLDCGESVFEILFKKKLLDEVEDAYVMITHLHADHVGSLGSLISYFYCIRNMKIHVFHPESTLVDLLSLEGINRDGYSFSQAFFLNDAGINVESVPVNHAKEMNCYGYILRDEEKTLYYSGDSADVPERVRDLFLSGDIDEIYHDTSTHNTPNPSHCYYGKLEQAFPKEKRANVFCMHLDSPCEEILKEKGFRIAGESERKIE